MAMKTADIADTFEGQVRACMCQFHLFGRRMIFGGEIATVKCFEDNALVLKMIEQPGRGRVLVVDGGGSLRYAIFGDRMVTVAIKNGWAGAVVNGAIRDSRQIDEMDFGLLAIGRTCLRASKRGWGEVDAPLSFGNVDFIPGHFVYCDHDGVLVTARELPLA